MSKYRTIDEVVKNNLCTGCGTCVVVCAHSAIKLIREGSKGIYIPIIDKAECNRCGICFDVCPGYQVDPRRLDPGLADADAKNILLGNHLHCYVGHATDYNIRYNSASGGLVTAMLLFALENKIIDGALVTKMNEDNPLDPLPFIGWTKDEIISAAGSKYCPVPANIGLKEIIEKKGKYAVVGLPCHLNGVRKAMNLNSKLKERIVLLIGIFCSGTPNFRATDFLLYRLKLPKEEVKTLEYRGKGWPGNMSLELKSSGMKHIPYPKYCSGWNLFYPFRCKVCTDWFSNLADISFGDAWLPEIKQNDKIGTSILVSRNKVSEDILQRMVITGKIELEPIVNDKVLKSQGGFSEKRQNIKICFKQSRLGKGSLINDCCLLQPSIWTYLRSDLVYFGDLLASRRSLWWLLNIYCSLLVYGSRLKSRLNL